MKRLQYKLIILITVVNFAMSHIMKDRKELSGVQKNCENAYTCFHDTVIVCGESHIEARTFLDLCDLYEFSCEHNIFYRHVQDKEDFCPNPEDLPTNAGKK